MNRYIIKCSSELYTECYICGKIIKVNPTDFTEVNISINTNAQSPQYTYAYFTNSNYSLNVNNNCIEIKIEIPKIYCSDKCRVADEL